MFDPVLVFAIHEYWLDPVLAFIMGHGYHTLISRNNLCNKFLNEMKRWGAGGA